MKIIIKKILKEVTNLDQNGNDIAVELTRMSRYGKFQIDKTRGLAR